MFFEGGKIVEVNITAELWLYFLVYFYIAIFGGNPLVIVYLESKYDMQGNNKVGAGGIFAQGTIR